MLLLAQHLVVLHANTGMICAIWMSLFFAIAFLYVVLQSVFCVKCAKKARNPGKMNTSNPLLFCHAVDHNFMCNYFIFLKVVAYPSKALLYHVPQDGRYQEEILVVVSLVVSSARGKAHSFVLIYLFLCAQFLTAHMTWSFNNVQSSTTLCVHVTVAR